MSFFSVLQQSAIRKHLEKLITQLINTLTLNVFGVVSDDGVEQKVVIVGVVRPDLAPLPLQLQVVVNGLHSLLRPGPQTSFETLHF